MNARLHAAIQDLLQTWSNSHSDDPISEIWDEIIELSKAFQEATHPVELTLEQKAELLKQVAAAEPAYDADKFR